MKKPYAVAYLVTKDNGRGGLSIDNYIVILQAVDVPDAIGQGVSIALRKFPRSDGYENHSAVAILVESPH